MGIIRRPSNHIALYTSCSRMGAHVLGFLAPEARRVKFFETPAPQDVGESYIMTMGVIRRPSNHVARYTSCSRMGAHVLGFLAPEARRVKFLETPAPQDVGEST
jgi:hypothetical protein